MTLADDLLRVPIKALRAYGSCNPPAGQRPGEEHSAAKLTNEQAREIRSEYAKGHTSYTRLAKKYAVSWPTIRSIVKGRSYKDAGGYR